MKLTPASIVFLLTFLCFTHHSLGAIYQPIKVDKLYTKAPVSLVVKRGCREKVKSDSAYNFNDELISNSRNNFAIVLFKSSPDFVPFKYWLYLFFAPSKPARPGVYNPYYSRATSDYYSFLFRLTPF